MTHKQIHLSNNSIDLDSCLSICIVLFCYMWNIHSVYILLSPLHIDIRTIMVEQPHLVLNRYSSMFMEFILKQSNTTITKMLLHTI